MDRAEFERNIASLYHPNLVRRAAARAEQGQPGSSPLLQSDMRFEQYEYKVREKQFVVLWNSDGKDEGQAFIPVDRAELTKYLGAPIQDTTEKPR